MTSTDHDAMGEVLWLEHRATRHREQTDRRRSRGQADPVEILAGLMDRFDTVAIPALERWADPAVLANALELRDVPFRHGELLFGLDLPTGPRRSSTIEHLREHAGNR